MTTSATSTNGISGFKSATADIGGGRLHYLVGGDPNDQPLCPDEVVRQIYALTGRAAAN